MAIAVGDTVTWRQGKSKAKRNMPLGIAGCRVIDLGEDAARRPAAMLRLPAMFDDAVRDQGLNPDWGVAALVADLEKNE